MSSPAILERSTTALLRRQVEGLRETLALKMAKRGLLEIPSSPESARIWGEMGQRFFRPLLEIRSPGDLNDLIARVASDFAASAVGFVHTLRDESVSPQETLPPLRSSAQLDPLLAEALQDAAEDFARAGEILCRLPLDGDPSAEDAKHLLTATSGCTMWLLGYGGISLITRGHQPAAPEVAHAGLALLVREGARGMFVGLRGMELDRLPIESTVGGVPDWMEDDAWDLDAESAADEEQADRHAREVMELVESP